jgi:iron complex transport system ATP-binding protein
VIVLHDLSLAARYVDILVAMKDGSIVASVPPAEVSGLRALVAPDPATGTPQVAPWPRAR